jgi:hypothetical protein
MVYVTGDFMNHFAEHYDLDRTVRKIKFQTERLTKDYSHVKVYPTIGNHDDYTIK